MSDIETIPSSLTNIILAISQATIPAKFISHRRAQRRLHPNEALVRIEHVDSAEKATRYVGLECMLGKVYDSCTKLTRQGKREYKKKVTVDNDAPEQEFSFSTGTFQPKSSTIKFKTVLGRIVKPHGNKGVVVVRFERNLAPVEINSRVYVKLSQAAEYEE